MKFGIVWFLGLFLLLSSCNEFKSNEESSGNAPNSNEAETTPVVAELEGIWILQTFNKETIRNNTSYKNPTIKINLSEGTVSGNSGCNKYSGNIRFLKEKQFKIELVNTTEVACPQYDLEERYLQAITGTILIFKLNGNEAIFYNDKTTLIFEKSK